MLNVIACIDNTSISTAVSDYAAWSSKRMDAPLVLLHVLQKAEYVEPTDLSGNIGLGSRETLLQELAELDQQRGKLAREEGRLLLQHAADRVKTAGIEHPVSLQRHGNFIDTLVEMEKDTRLLVMGKHDEKLGDHVGSRLETVVRTMQHPILVCTPDFKAPSSIMIAYDGSATTHKVVDTVAGSPLFRGLPCHVVMVGNDNKSNRGQLEWARHTLESADFDVVTHLSSGEVERVLCDYRQDQAIDMLLMGAYGHSVIRRFLVGSTTTGILRNAQIPVLLLR